MRCSLHLDYFFPEQFETKPRSRRSKNRDKELETIKERGQQRRIVVSIYGEVLPSDIPLYEALLVVGYAAIAVVVVVGASVVVVVDSVVDVVDSVVDVVDSVVDVVDVDVVVVVVE